LKKTKILIAGIGGVGGYLGAMLATTFENNDEIDITF
jgi:ketopantoate reductase